MICPPLPPAPVVQGWISRHKNPASFVLHMVGIPPTIVGVLLAPVYLFGFSGPTFVLALALFAGGYLIQFLGHGLEGTDPGEIIYFKKKLGLPYNETVLSRRSGRSGDQAGRPFGRGLSFRLGSPRV